MKASVAGTLVLAVATVGCSSSPQDEVRRFEQASSFEFYSLEPLSDPDTHEMDYDPNGPGERLHGWRILGKTTVSDASARRELIGALKEGLVKGGRSAKCFYPRHAIRRTDGGKPIDLLICFECGNVALYRDGKQVPESATIAPSTQATFDEALRKADIPLAKKGKR